MLRDLGTLPVPEARVSVQCATRKRKKTHKSQSSVLAFRHASLPQAQALLRGAILSTVFWQTGDMENTR